MSTTVISIENLSKAYRLGQINRDTLAEDLKFRWAKVRGKPDPLLKIGMEDFGNRAGATIWALKDVSFTVEQGEILGIIGRNGAGKSTLLKILSKVTAPTKGEVKIRGRIASLLEVGTGFHPELTGRENIYLNGAILGMNKAEITLKFDEIVGFSGVEQFIDTPVKRYSSGMYVRLAFAVAAHLESEILLIDEVLAVGDASFQSKCIGKMGDVARGGRTVLFVSHNLAAVEGLCKSAILLDSGKMMFRGVARSTIERYISSSTDMSGAEVSLQNHPNRRAGCEILFHGIEIYNGSIPTTTIGMGESLEIAVTIERGNRIVQDLGISVENVHGQRLFAPCPDYQGYDMRDITFEKFKVVCRIPKLTLLPGIYYISLIAADRSLVLDKIERAVSFTVVERDVYKTGRHPKAKDGVFYTTVQWRFEGIR